ncbi:hypothetical protein GCM10029976_080370 [Kribbella albertanoniae]|uniref:hypothetical protein n=1 Tax=Kribbella albertanoniae TaxID=1266829 RepID=UPI00140536CB|nr:hypothetical protein [Kribbella albertanoniae]
MSMLLVFTVGVFVLIRYTSLTIIQAAICTSFGFFLASSRFAPFITQFFTQFLGAK